MPSDHELTRVWFVLPRDVVTGWLVASVPKFDGSWFINGAYGGMRITFVIGATGSAGIPEIITCVPAFHLSAAEWARFQLAHSASSFSDLMLIPLVNPLH